MKNEDMEKRFLEGIKNHKMKIIKDDGLYKHLRFKAPDTYCMYFDIITYPGGLLYTGDAGTFVFSRIEDMIDFFRNDKKELLINPCYWAEKVKAESISGGGIKEFDSEIWKKRIIEYWEEYYEDDIDSEKAQITLSEIHENIFHGESSEWYWVSTIYNADFTDKRFAGWDLFESLGDGKKYTWHYLWCCYALSWAVIQYDNNK